MSVMQAVELDLERIRKTAPELADGPLAATSRVLAAELDNDRNSATSKSMCARAMLDVLDRLQELMPSEKERSKLDDLASRRAIRLAGGTAPTGLLGS